MEDLSKQLYIAKLIAKSLQGELPSPEQDELDSWLADPANQHLYRSLRTKDLQARKQQATTIDTEKNWRAIKRQITSARRPYTLRWVKYAAVMAIPVLLAGVLLFRGRTAEPTVPPTTVAADALPGSSRAVLILSDGQKVDLTVQQNFRLRNDTAVTVDNQGNTLTIAGNDRGTTKQGNYQTLSIPVGGEYKLVLPDGTKIWLNSDTRLRFPSSFTGDRRVVHLDGEAYFEVAPDKRHPFIVSAEGMDIEVLGTKFNVKAYSSDLDIHTTLAEGAVRTTVLRNTSSIVLTPNQQCRYDKASGIMDKKEVDARTYIGWTQGKFIFDNETLEEIMKQLGRWYATETVYQSPEIKGYRFTGHVDRFDNISTILRMIEKTYNITFDIQGNTVIINK